MLILISFLVLMTCEMLYAFSPHCSQTIGRLHSVRNIQISSVSSSRLLSSTKNAPEPLMENIEPSTSMISTKTKSQNELVYKIHDTKAFLDYLEAGPKDEIKVIK